ncbi:MAG: carbohydrate ABC transporter permease [Lachnospiraceae bacterium]|nr:carbohydrate ABC transporter permease [Lachnospiraceae bacterium]
MLMNKIRRKLGKIFQTFLAVFITFIIIFPIYWMVVTSLKDKNELVSAIPTLFPQKIQIESYKKILSNPDMILYFKNTVIMTAGIMVLQLCTCTFAAYGLAVGKFKGRKVILGVILGAMMLPQQVTFIPIYIFFARLGLVNTFVAMIIPDATSTFFIYLMYTAFNSIDKNLVDIGKCDGLTRIQMLRYIYIPACKPIFVTAILMSFINSWNAYFWPRIITNNKTHRVLSIGINYLKVTSNSGDAISNYNEIMAGVFISILPITILFFTFQKYIIKNKFV